MKTRTILPAALLVLLTACAGPEFPKQGTASPFDGQWTGNLKSNVSACSGLSVNGEIKYGYLIATVKETGQNRNATYQFWGQIDQNGELSGLLGQHGVSGGYANVKFNNQSATGTWSSSNCDGTVAVKKAS